MFGRKKLKEKIADLEWMCNHPKPCNVGDVVKFDIPLREKPIAISVVVTSVEFKNDKRCIGMGLNITNRQWEIKGFDKKHNMLRTFSNYTINK